MQVHMKYLLTSGHPVGQEEVDSITPHLAGPQRPRQFLPDLAQLPPDRRIQFRKTARRQLIPGILQTAEYAEAVLRRVTEFYRIPNDVDQGVSKRLEQQKVLYHGDHRFHILIAEQSLSTTVGTAEVMTGQLDRLLAVMGLPRMLFGVVPSGAEWLTPATNFVMFDDRMVLVEAITAELKITQPREIALYARAFETLAGQSVTGKAARALVGPRWTDGVTSPRNDEPGSSA